MANGAYPNTLSPNHPTGGALEATFIVIVALVVLGGGAVALLSRQRSLPRSFPVLRLSGGATETALEPEDARDSPLDPETELSPISSRTSVGPSLSEGRTKGRELRLETIEPRRLDLVPAMNDVFADRLGHIEARLDELHRAVTTQSEQLAAEMRRANVELMLRADADEAKRDAAQERLRADLLSIAPRLASDRQVGASARRLEVSAELYARLARLEAALATVTNPILLPGEPYAPPGEFLPETLIWENWNEVGERAFALADAFSAQRLHLSARTRADVGGFVTGLRMLLTRSIYPSLQSELDMAQQATLRAALEEIAVELPRVRDMLEQEYRDERDA